MHHPCYAITCIEENGIDADDIFSTAEEGYLTLITHVSSSGVLRCRTSGIEIQPNCIIYNGCRRKSQDFCCYVSGKLLETRLALVSLQTWRRVYKPSRAGNETTITELPPRQTTNTMTNHNREDETINNVAQSKRAMVECVIMVLLCTMERFGVVLASTTRPP